MSEILLFGAVSEFVDRSSRSIKQPYAGWVPRLKIKNISFPFLINAPIRVCLGLWMFLPGVA